MEKSSWEKDTTLSLLISIHDVMPHTLSLAEAILRSLLDAKLRPITMLIVPGLGWTRADLRLLEQYQANGVSLAGHGWQHACVPKKPLHRLHSRFLSRNVAEHLALQASQIKNLIRDCYAWFPNNGLLAPSLYVPPAWAMGSLPSSRCKDLPFRYYETLSGIYDAQTDTLKKLPLLGFEADTSIRKRLLNLTNRLNLAWVQHSGLPLRVAIHPMDFKLRLSAELEYILKSCQQAIGYDDGLLWNNTAP